MTKQITSLVDDIYGLMGSGHVPSPEALDQLGKAIAQRVADALKKREPRGELRGSIIGTQCDRKLYYDVNTPEDAEGFEPHVLLKFLYGHIYEEIALFLSAEAGHKVTNRQLEVDVNGVKGHIDAVIDGVLVDVKSASGYGMGKFIEHRLEHDDPFGYLAQIDFYKEGTKDVSEISVRGTVGFLAVDKSTGKLVLDLYRRGPADSKKLLERVEHAIDLVSSDSEPDRGFSDIPDGTSGNRKLCTECSYCPYKQKCWSGLRSFVYSNTVKYLTKVLKEPRVNEQTNRTPAGTDGSPDT